MRSKARQRTSASQRQRDRLKIPDADALEAIGAVVGLPGVLARILSSMTRREAARLASTCQAFKAAYKHSADLDIEFQPVVLIACSATSRLLELNPSTRKVTSLCKLSITMKPHKSRLPLRWATGLTSRHGIVYASQYQVGPLLAHVASGMVMALAWSWSW
jgi:hypothetical protein